MQKITRLKFYELIENIKQHKREMNRLNEGLSLIIDEDVYSKYGGLLLDSYIDLLIYVFDDQKDLIVWFIFENEFGKNKLHLEINGEQMRIDNTIMLFHQLKTEKRRRQNEKS